MHFWSLSFLLPFSIFFLNTVTINWHFFFCPIISNQGKLEAVIEVLGNLTLHVGIILRRLLLLIPVEFLTEDSYFPMQDTALQRLVAVIYMKKRTFVFFQSLFIETLQVAIRRFYL